MNSRNNRNSIITISIVASLIVITIIFSSLNVVSIFKTLDSIKSNEVVLSQLNDEVAVLKDIAEDEPKMNTLIEEFEEILPENIEQYEIYNTVGELSQEYDVTLNKIAFEEVIVDETVVDATTTGETTVLNSSMGLTPHKIIISLSLQGSYESVMAMLETLSLDYRVTVISSLNLTNSEKNVIVESQLSIYYR